MGLSTLHRIMVSKKQQMNISLEQQTIYASTKHYYDIASLSCITLWQVNVDNERHFHY